MVRAVDEKLGEPDKVFCDCSWMKKVEQRPDMVREGDAERRDAERGA